MKEALLMVAALALLGSAYLHFVHGTFEKCPNCGGRMSTGYIKSYKFCEKCDVVYVAE